MKLAAPVDTVAWPGLRPMMVSHLDDVITIENQAYEFPWTRGNFIDSLAAGYWAQVLTDTRHGGLIGYIVAMPGVGEMHLLNVTVASPHRGQGHGRRMLALLAEHAASQDWHTLWLEVRASNAHAMRLYEAIGYRVVGLRKGYYPAAQGQREDALVMRWDREVG